MDPCKFCNLPLLSDDYPSIPAHVLCCLRYLDDKAEKERESCSRCLKPFTEENPQAFHARDHVLITSCEECMEARRLRDERAKRGLSKKRIETAKRTAQEEKLHRAQMEELRQIASQRINGFC